MHVVFRYQTTIPDISSGSEPGRLMASRTQAYERLLDQGKDEDEAGGVVVADFLREKLSEMLFSESVDIGADVANAISIACDKDLDAYASWAAAVATLSSMSFAISCTPMTSATAVLGRVPADLENREFPDSI